MRYDPFYCRIATQQPWPRPGVSWVLYPSLQLSLYSTGFLQQKLHVLICLKTPAVHRDAPSLQQVLVVSLTLWEVHLLSVPQHCACKADTSSADKHFPRHCHAALSLGSPGVDEILQWLLEHIFAHKGPHGKGASHEGPLQPQVLGQFWRLALYHLIIASHPSYDFSRWVEKSRHKEPILNYTEIEAYRSKD